MSFANTVLLIQKLITSFVAKQVRKWGAGFFFISRESEECFEGGQMYWCKEWMKKIFLSIFCIHVYLAIHWACK